MLIKLNLNVIYFPIFLLQEFCGIYHSLPVCFSLFYLSLLPNVVKHTFNDAIIYVRFVKKCLHFYRNLSLLYLYICYVLFFIHFVSNCSSLFIC